MITTNSTPYGTYIQIVSWSKYQGTDKNCIAKPIKVAYNNNDINKDYKPLTKINKLI